MTISKNLSIEDETLLIDWDTLLVLDLSLEIFDCITRVDIDSDSITHDGFQEDLHLQK